MKKILQLESERVILKHDVFYNDDTRYPYHDLYNNQVVVVYFLSTNAVRDARIHFKETYQDDVQYERVFRITKNIYGFFDIRDVKTVLKRRPIFLTANINGVEIRGDVPFYRVSHFDIRGF